ncbi:xyloglucan galactosyltransferase KATAMARI1 [Carex littledalei]|uniref:Xyloglucan galactosyltransferase KATAMARI1 n=1 Tax=Carex littledalei TaxID=544730 RepID=A0A833QNH9_9POAL|nr:xyloglucan galactosyltransferase KATAMARI1 [Carex littledalei]
MSVKVLTFLAFFSIACYLFFPSYSPNFDIFANSVIGVPPVQSKQCDPDIAPFYIYDLPPRFSEPLIRNCSGFNPWKNMCPYFENQGMGQPLNKSSWYNTYQLTADMIFHGRAINHPCRTKDSSSALVFYIPFHTSLFVHAFGSDNNIARREAIWFDLLDHISSLPTFQRHGGHDHFLVSGHMAWNFIRPPKKDGEPSRLNDFLKFPQLSNVSALIIERNTLSNNQFGIPYPSYFHPQSDAEIRSWQDEVRRSDRTHLFAFVGGARHKGHGAESYRTAVISQCNRTESCLLLQCNFWGAVWDEVDEILGTLKRSHFCLQPPGDSSTRRSIFDSILTGCVPVFFTDLSAYLQYEWYIPERREDWSVLIGPDQLYQIEEVLSQIPEKEVERMREVVIGMIPRVTYGHPNATWAEVGFRDAVDTALVELTKRARHIKDGTDASLEN